MWVFEGLDSFGASSPNQVLTVLDGRRVDFVILRKISYIRASKPNRCQAAGQ